MAPGSLPQSTLPILIPRSSYYKPSAFLQRMWFPSTMLRYTTVSLSLDPLLQSPRLPSLPHPSFQQSARRPFSFSWPCKLSLKAQFSPISYGNAHLTISAISTIFLKNRSLVTCNENLSVNLCVQSMCFIFQQALSGVAERALTLVLERPGFEPQLCHFLAL